MYMYSYTQVPGWHFRQVRGLNLLLNMGHSKPQILLQWHNVKAHAGVSKHAVQDLGKVSGCAGGSWKLWEEFKVQSQVCQRCLCFPPTMAQENWHSRVIACAILVLGSFGPHILSSLDTPAPPHTSVTPSWCDITLLSPETAPALQGKAHPQPLSLGSALPAWPWALENLQLTLKKDFRPAVALARGSVIWYLTRAWKVKLEQRRLNGKAGNQVTMTLVSLKCSDTAEPSHIQWPLASSFLLGAEHGSLPASRSASHFHCQGERLL